ncbi:MAG: ribosome-associated translation inhibitor RaiA [Acidobacteriota bacterium]|nr:ribosome-associated translation inhibitor RaiA [Acidobacteriota bacterium]
MKVTYTGSEDFSSKQRDKLEGKLRRISKMLDRKGEKEAHVIFSQERFLQKVEITINAHDHALAGAGLDGDLFTATCLAVEKIEKQVVKMRTKWRDTHRHKSPKDGAQAAAPEPTKPLVKEKAGTPRKSSAAKAAGPKNGGRVYKVVPEDSRKPMSIEEAMLEMGNSQDYLVYRDSKTNRVSVLMRRPDGHLDLVES